MGTDTHRRRFLRAGLALAGLGLASGCGLVSTPGPRPVSLPRIGYLDTGVNDPSTEAAFREGLRDLGYVEGQNIVVEYRSAEGKLERLPALAAGLVSLPVEIIVVSNAASAGIAASRATSTLPIVTLAGNVVDAGLVVNIAHPEGNVTGVATNAVGTVGKWIELLEETVPTISRLAALLDRSNPVSQAFLEQMQRATQTLNLQLTPYDLRGFDQLPALLATAGAERADGLVVVPGGVVGGAADPRIGRAVLQARLPVVAEQRWFAVNGGLLALGPSPTALARRSASYVDKLLRGAKPGDLPIELPTTFEIVVNLKSAQALGLTISQSVLARATEIIQ